MSALIVLYIILGLILLLGALLFLRIRFIIECNTDILVKLSVLGIKFKLYPKNKSKIKLAAFKKGYPKQAKTKKPKNPEKVKEVPKIPLTDKIAALTSLMRLLLSKFFGHLRLDISKK